MIRQLFLMILVYFLRIKWELFNNYKIKGVIVMSLKKADFFNDVLWLVVFQKF